MHIVVEGGPRFDGRCYGSVNDGFRRATLCAATRKIGNVCAPSSIARGHQNCEIVLHGRPPSPDQDCVVLLGDWWKSFAKSGNARIAGGQVLAWQERGAIGPGRDRHSEKPIKGGSTGSTRPKTGGARQRQNYPIELV